MTTNLGQLLQSTLGKPETMKHSTSTHSVYCVHGRNSTGCMECNPIQHNVTITFRTQIVIGKALYDDIRLLQADNNQVAAIKLIRDSLKLSLRMAKDIADRIREAY